MAKIHFCLFLISFLFGTFVHAGNKSTRQDDDDKQWCIVQDPLPSNDKMQGFLDYACSQIICDPLQPGGDCYEPNTLASHTSFALDMYYDVTFECNPEIGRLITQDPSYDGCRYPCVH
ncbi:hypothetical protein ACP275_09G094200 [Erythranthe tilingii]